MRRVLLLLGAVCALAMVLSACDGPVSGVGPTSSRTSAATVTPTVPRLMPSSVPSGWQVYEGPHFAIAYPPDWLFSSNPVSGGPPNGTDTAYSFVNHSASAGISVNEQDGWDAATIQQDFCPQQHQGTPTTVGNLTWGYSTAEGGALKNWIFITDHGTVYGMDSSDGDASAEVQKQDAAVMATFHAEYTTPGCK